jgi:hypothetical protein
MDKQYYHNDRISEFNFAAVHREMVPLVMKGNDFAAQHEEGIAKLDINQ